MQDTPMPEHEAMGSEYEAWRNVMAEWLAADLPGINDSKWNPLVRAIELWGECLVSLRLSQSPEDRFQILSEAVAKYEAVRTVER
jgi:hypothetical protein